MAAEERHSESHGRKARTHLHRSVILRCDWDDLVRLQDIDAAHKCVSVFYLFEIQASKASTHGKVPRQVPNPGLFLGQLETRSLGIRGGGRSVQAPSRGGGTGGLGGEEAAGGGGGRGAGGAEAGEHGSVQSAEERISGSGDSFGDGTARRLGMLEQVPSCKQSSIAVRRVSMEPDVYARLREDPSVLFGSRSMRVFVSASRPATRSSRDRPGNRGRTV